MGSITYDDLDYADDGALLPPDRALMGALLKRFDEEVSHLSLHVSWTKTKIHNVGYGGSHPALSVGANTVDSVSEFIYLGSKVTTDGRSALEIMRGIEPARSSVETEKSQLRHQTSPLRDMCPLRTLVLCGNLDLAQG